MAGWRRGAGPLVCAAVLLCLPACSQDGGRPVASPSGTPASMRERSAVLLAYYAYWRAVDEAGRTASWTAPALAASSTGAALQAVQRRLQTLSRNGQSQRGQTKVNPVVFTLTPPGATIRDCLDGSGVAVYDRAGRVVSRGARRLDYAQVTMVKEGGRWKVAEMNVQVGGC